MTVEDFTRSSQIAKAKGQAVQVKNLQTEAEQMWSRQRTRR